jgi:hypothetical protein
MCGCFAEVLFHLAKWQVAFGARPEIDADSINT